MTEDDGRKVSNALKESFPPVNTELRRDLWRYVRKLQSEGTTIILTTHYLDEAEELADRVGIINTGRLLLVEEKNVLIRRLGEKKLQVRFRVRLDRLSDALHTAGAVLSPDGERLDYVERRGRLSAADVLRLIYAERLPVADIETRRSRLEDVLLMVLHGTPRVDSAGAELAPAIPASLDVSLQED